MRSEAESRKYDGWHAADPTLPGGGPSPVRAIHDLHEGYQYDTTEMIGDIHCTVVMKLVKCSPEVDARKVRANHASATGDFSDACAAPDDKGRVGYIGM